MSAEEKKEKKQKKSAEELIKIAKEKYKIKMQKLKAKAKQEKNSFSKANYEKLKRFEEYNKTDFWFSLCEYLNKDFRAILYKNGYDGSLKLNYIKSVLEKNLEFLGTKKES